MASTRVGCAARTRDRIGWCLLLACVPAFGGSAETDLVVSVSIDGVGFREVGRAANQVPDDERDVVRADMVVDVGGAEARYLRLVAHGDGTIPDWHPGRGGAALIFVDEILVQREIDLP